MIDGSLVEFSSDDLPAGDRLARCREHFERLVMRLEFEPAAGTAFDMTLTTRSLPGLHLHWMTYSPGRVNRTDACLEDGSDDFLFYINLHGRVSLSTKGGKVELVECDAVLTSANNTFVFDHQVAGRSLLLQIPRSTLAPFVTDIEASVLRRISAELDALRVLTRYLNSFFTDIELVSAGLPNLVSCQIGDLVALTLGAMCEERRNRLHVAKAYIAENSGVRGLSVTAVAKHLKMSSRQVQRLFESEGTTFSAFLLGHRLARARRMLCEPRYQHLKMGEIAISVGFSDLPHFSRCFRKVYGSTPGVVRREGKQSHPCGPNLGS